MRIYSRKAGSSKWQKQTNWGYPVIGIVRRSMDEGGPLKVRESLEEQTMNMAKSAAELFRQNIRYSNGEPVKVIIADTTIGRVAEAAA